VLRRFIKQQPLESKGISVYILSAEFGLIRHDQLIPYYDHRMTRTRAQTLQPGVIAELRRILSTNYYRELFISVGRDYLSALDGYDTLIPAHLIVKQSTGGLGKKLSELHDWLYGKPPEVCNTLPMVAPQGKARLKGVEVALTPQQVLDVARQALIEGKGKPTAYQSWYVPIDDKRLAPKWLVSQLTGLPVSSFHSGEARRVLQQLGLQVYAE
jgi:hypothetical protein